MFGRLFLLFLVVPALDLFVLVTVGARLGFWPTFGLVLLSALVGAYLAKREGLAALRRVQDKLAGGGLPGPELVDGLIVLFSGALLLTPGFITDIVGLAGLLPPVRAVVRRYAQARLARGVASGQVRMFGFGRPPGAPFGGGPFGGPVGGSAPLGGPFAGPFGPPPTPPPPSPRPRPGIEGDVVEATFEDVPPAEGR